jgi:hypothetical protein
MVIALNELILQEVRALQDASTLDTEARMRHQSLVTLIGNVQERLAAIDVRLTVLGDKLASSDVQSVARAALLGTA